jgi:hypothetical protein
MTRLVLLIPFALTACAGTLPAVPPPTPEVRPVVAQDNLQGQWKIAAVNGRIVDGPWILFGGEGLGTATDTGGSIVIESPQPPTRAYLGCNDLRLNGWVRNGDKLVLGIDHAMKSERGCEPATMALEEQVHAVIGKTMTMELTPPDRLRLINEVGTLDLLRENN